MASAPPQNPTALPVLETPLAPAEVLARLDALARSGKLAGYRERDGGFRVDAFASPFEKVLDATITPGPPSRIAFNLRLVRKLPFAFWIITLLTIWPGVWVTDSMLRLYFDAYRIETWWWYLPLTILPIPWMWRTARRKSDAGAAAAAAEVISAIAAAVDAAHPPEAQAMPR